jgi:hypothetical protein
MGTRLPVRVVLVSAVMAVIASLLGMAEADAAKKTPPGNPPGNNGRIKTGSDAEAEPNDEPHIDGCRLWLEFFGFDTEEQAVVTFVTLSPTGNDDPLLTWQGTVSDDPDAGDQHDDNVIGFNLSEALQPFKPHPQQGYHVKVSWDSVNAPGGEKHKVFWLDCTTAPPGTFTVKKLVSGTDPSPGPFTLQVTCNHTPADKEVTISAGGSEDIPVPMGTSCAVSENDAQGATVSFTESPGDGQNDGTAQVTGDAPAVVTVVNTFPGTTTQDQPGTTEDQGTPKEQQATSQGSTTPSGTQDTGTPSAVQPTAVAGETLTAPAAADTLPRTGAETGGLASVGAWALALGGLTLIATHRRYDGPHRR